MAHTLTVAVHVDLRVNGEDLSGDYGPGDVNLPEPVAALLTAQGLATPSKGKTSKSPAAHHDTEA